ncbi:MAG: hypothetical protein JXQ87_01175 [Bacteroidia bacterium]
MKKLIHLAILFALIGCDNKASKSNNESTTNIVTAFLKNVRSLEDVENGNPIIAFSEQASTIADATFSLDKGGAEDLFETAKNYTHCVIVVEDHTIVKIDDFDDCQQSGSWGACMPMGNGYIKHGNLDSEKDYINNIIGTPDGKERKVYLFK